MKKVKILTILFLFALIFVTLYLPQVNAQQPPNFYKPEEILIAQQIEQKPFDEIIEGSQKLEGLFTLYENSDTGKVYLELKPEQLNQNFLCFSVLESGIGEEGIFSGLELNEFLFQWQRLQNKVQFVIPNINFRTQSDDPQSRSMNRSFSDSVLYSLPILSIHPERQTILLDFSSLLTSDRDLAGLKSQFASFFGRSYSLNPNNSYLASVKSFPYNVEVESVFGFTSIDDSSLKTLPTLPDSRAFNLKVRYSFLEVPKNNYRPRFADERVGYFTTTYKDLSNQSGNSSFIRYINRWNLEKLDPKAELSPPVNPIVFWIENTVPMEYRDAIANGILMWNKAFEKAGFINAIQVKQMPDDATWHPADVRYNTIRWSTSFEPAFNGYGPSHTNPLTGEILDADIVLESNALTKLKEGAGVFVEATQTAQKSSSCSGKGSENSDSTHQDQPNFYETLPSESTEHLCFSYESNQQLAIGSITLNVLENISPQNSKLQQYVNQYIGLLVSHEVGHTLGLRHNFHGSTLLSPKELNDPSITQTKGLVGSVMDYLPVNLAPQGTPQGDYFPTIIGPYDEWAIEYGYKPLPDPNSYEEIRTLQTIAQRSSQPELSYATDEDYWGVSLDPAANTFDLSSDMLQYAQWQFDNALALWKRLEERSPNWNEGYNQMREMFNTIFGYYQRQALNVTLYIGGQSFSRTRSGNADARLPFEPIPVEKQRESLKTLQKYVFADNVFQFSPDFLNKLAPSRWSDWGNTQRDSSLDYPLSDRILSLQRDVLRSVFSPTRLARLRDLELKTTPNNVLTLPELFETLQNSIWTEVLQPQRPLSISSVRRALQREHLEILSLMVLRKITVPEDAQTLAWYQLRQLSEILGQTVKSEQKKLDAYTLAHLEKTHDRILKILDAPVQSN